MTIFEEAEKIISGPRREAYGDVFESFNRIAKLWSDIFGVSVSASQVCIAMAAFKAAREANKHGRDNLVDIVGYLMLEQKLADTEPLPF